MKLYSRKFLSVAVYSDGRSNKGTERLMMRTVERYNIYKDFIDSNIRMLDCWQPISSVLGISVGMETKDIRRNNITIKSRDRLCVHVLSRRGLVYKNLRRKDRYR